MSEKSIFDTMTEEQIMELVKERGLPGLKPFCKTQQDLERLVDVVEKNISEVFPGMSMPASAAPVPAPAESKEDTEKPEKPEEDNTKGALLSEEVRAKLEAMEADFEKEAAAEMNQERREQLAAWNRIRNKGAIPIKFEGDQNTPIQHQKRKILFLCNDNSCLSQMAEALTFAKFHEVFDCASAGFDPKPLVDPLAVATLMAQDIDICSWRTKSIAKVQEIHFDMICPLDNESHLKAKEFDWHGAQLIGGMFDVPTIAKLKRDNDEMIAARKARRAIRELERRQAAGEKIEIEDLLKEEGLEARLAEEDSESDHEDDDGIDPRIRLMPNYRDLSRGLKDFVDSIPQILAFAGQ